MPAAATPPSRTAYARFIKPLMEWVLALVAFAVLSPVFIVVVVLLAIANRGKPFFLQRRPGRGGYIFRDEIPQLLNVIKGDMALVGPRPLLEEYLPLYDKTQMHRHDVRPGITGWAQVNGRNAISWQQKFAYDVWYVNNLSFAVDIRILLLTVRNVLRSEGISSETSATMEKFRGNQ